MPITCSAVNISRKSLLRELVLDGLIGISPRFLRSTTQSVFSVPLLQWLRSLGHWLTQYVNFSRKLELFHHTNLIFFVHRTTPKTQYTGCSVHENNNGQAAFENPMYNTNAKAVEGKAVRFDPNLNTVCTMV